MTSNKVIRNSRMQFILFSSLAGTCRKFFCRACPAARKSGREMKKCSGKIRKSDSVKSERRRQICDYFGPLFTLIRQEEVVYMISIRGIAVIKLSSKRALRDFL
jgi:hypothetical protein